MTEKYHEYVERKWGRFSEVRTDLVKGHTRSDGLILEIGCYNRIYESAVKERKGIYVGLDVKKWFSFPDIVADAHSLPFREHLFDLVIIFDTLEHLDDPQKALGEIYRVLKNGGKILLSVPNWFNPNAYLDPTHKTVWTMFSLKRRLENENFKTKILGINVPEVVQRFLHVKGLSSKTMTLFPFCFFSFVIFAIATKDEPETKSFKKH